MLHAALLAALTTSPLAPPLLAQTRQLANEPGLELEVIGAQGNVLQLEQTHNGLRVLNTRGSAELDASGRIIRLDRSWKTIRGTLPPVKVSVQQAMRTAFEKAGVDFDRLPTPTLTAAANVAILIESDKPRLVYELPVLSVNPFDRLTAIVDATTGVIIRMRNATVTADNQANVFDPNPKTTPATVQRTVTTNDNLAFKGAKIDTRNCTHNTAADLEYSVVPYPSTGEFAQYKQLVETVLGKKIDWVVAPLCKEQATAAPNQAHVPVLDQTLPSAKNDKFAEGNFYYHADRVANYFATPGAGNLNAGFAGRAGDPLRGSVNFMTPAIATVICTTAMYTPPANTADTTAVRAAAIAAFKVRGDQTDIPNYAKCSDFKTQQNPTDKDFSAFDNAFFMPSVDAEQLGPLAAFLGNFRNFDSMVFGQGTIDFAYDSSVIYHEYTHGVVYSVGALQDGIARDKWGLDYAPGAMNEGLSDYFASVLTPTLDGCMGPYSAVLMGPNATCLRDLKAESRCPDDLIGEVHHDAAPFSEALWAIRGSFSGAADKAEFDKAVFETLAKPLAGDAQFSHFFEGLLGRMTAHGLATANAEDIVRKKNVLACERVIALKEIEKAKAINLAGTGTAGDGDFAPGFVQYRLDVPALTSEIEVTVLMEAAAAPGGVQIPGGLGGQQEADDVRVLVKTTGAVAFEYPIAGVPSGAEELELSKKGKALFSVKKKTDGPWYIALANYNGGGHTVKEVSFKVTEKFEDVKPEGAKDCAADVNGWCPSDQACVNGACVTITVDQKCSATKKDGLCAGGFACVDGSCKVWTPPATPPTSNNPPIATGGTKGCGCHSSSSSDGFLVLAAALFVLRAMRRRRK